MIYDVLNLIAQFVMIYIMVLIWKLPNISTDNMVQIKQASLQHPQLETTKFKTKYLTA
jgi:hypothetical protein